MIRDNDAPSQGDVEAALEFAALLVPHRLHGHSEKQMEQTTPRYVGRSVPRREDRRLLLGGGRFIADIQLSGMLHVAFVRSEVAHARIRAIPTDRALSSPGIVAIFTAQISALICFPFRVCRTGRPRPGAKRSSTSSPFPISRSSQPARSAYVGEAIAVVIADRPLLRRGRCRAG